MPVKPVAWAIFSGTGGITSSGVYLSVHHIFGPGVRFRPTLATAHAARVPEDANGNS